MDDSKTLDDAGADLIAAVAAAREDLDAVESAVTGHHAGNDGDAARADLPGKVRKGQSRVIEAMETWEAVAEATGHR
jgi:hypothetical protein